MKLYFELADHPIIKIKYTDKVDKIKKVNIECILSNKEFLLKEIKGIIIIEIRRDKGGERCENIWFIISFEIKVLLKSLIASAIGCRIPIIPTLFGPFRIWIYLKVFRSIIV